MEQAESEELARHGRRWADVAWAQGWHAHAIEVLDKALELQPNDFKLHRKRGAFYLMCPDSTVRDEVQGMLDLRRACELANWRDDLVRWVADVFTQCGEGAQAKDLLREWANRGGKASGE